MRFISVTSKYSVFPQAPNSSESPGTSRTEHSDLLEEEEDERSIICIHLLIGGRFNIAGEGTAVGRRQVSRAAIRRVCGVDGGWLGRLRLCGLLLLIGRAAHCIGGISVGKFVDAGLSAMLTIHRAGRG